MSPLLPLFFLLLAVLQVHAAPLGSQSPDPAVSQRTKTTEEADAESLLARWSMSNVSERSNSTKLSIGTVSPAIMSNGVKRFTLPYAQSPTGHLRFANPQPLSKLPANYDASKTAASCMQILGVIGGNAPSEDCLYMNIYVPSTATADSKLPIIVWIHGGSFVQGSSTAAGLDGSTMAEEQNVIVVFIQYRLGIFGWLQSTNTFNEKSGGASRSATVAGNQAVRDVVTALSALHSYAAAFGGDVTKVAVTGQSSGAHMVRALLTTTAADNLFSRAILVSDTQDYGMADAANQNALGDYAMSLLNCSTIACMRSADSSALLEASYQAFDDVPSLMDSMSAGEPWRPMLGSYIPKRMEMIPSAVGSRKIWMSTMNNEAGSSVGSLFDSTVANATQLSYTEADNVSYSLAGAADLYFNDGRGDTLAAYSGYALNDTSDGHADGLREVLESMATDGLWRCPVQRNAVDLASAGKSVYLSWNMNGITYPDNALVSYCSNRHCHEDDIYAIWGTYPDTLSAAQTAMSKELRSRWAAFASTGNPNAKGYPTWSAVKDASSLNILQIGATSSGGSTVTQQQRPAYCSSSGPWGKSVEFDWQKYS